MATVPKSPASVPASQAKAQLLKLLDTVSTKRTAIIISKRGKPVAKLVPIEPEQRVPLFGRMKDKAEILGDIVGPDPEAWDSEK